MARAGFEPCQSGYARVKADFLDLLMVTAPRCNPHSEGSVAGARRDGDVCQVAYGRITETIAESTDMTTDSPEVRMLGRRRYCYQ